MVIEEKYYGNLVLHRSDSDKMIMQVETQNLYDLAIDNMPCKYTYVETSVSTEDKEISDEEFLNIIMGVSG